VELARLDELHDGSVVLRRPGSFCELRVDGDELSAFLGDRELRMPVRLETAMRFVAEAPGPFRVADVPGLADPASRLVLVRRLVREGLLQTAGG
jgi:hypothetical protein